MNWQDAFACDHPVALVTGSAAPRVGRVVAEQLAQSGCRIALHARSEASQYETQVAQPLRQAGVDVAVFEAELTDEAQVQRMVHQVTARFGRLDILVNSAAIWSPKPLEQVEAADLQRYFAVNTTACFVASKAAGLQMVQQPTGGCIINIGDWATVRPYLDHAAYFPSKGAIETLTRSLAVELGCRNPRVRVNCVQPGPVLLTPEVDEATRRRLADSILVKRIGTAQDVAHAVLFLCQNTFVTGVTLPVDGGRSIFANDGLQQGLNTG